MIKISSLDECDIRIDRYLQEKTVKIIKEHMWTGTAELLEALQSNGYSDVNIRFYDLYHCHGIDMTCMIEVNPNELEWLKAKYVADVTIGLNFFNFEKESISIVYGLCTYEVDGEIIDSCVLDRLMCENADFDWSKIYNTSEGD